MFKFRFSDVTLSKVSVLQSKLSSKLPIGTLDSTEESFKSTIKTFNSTIEKLDLALDVFTINNKALVERIQLTFVFIVNFYNLTLSTQFSARQLAGLLIDTAMKVSSEIFS